MKKIILLVISILSLCIASYAASNSELLETVENSVFGYDYKNESDTQRIERLEMQLYGEKRTGNLQKRLEKIQNDTGFIVQKEVKEEIPQNVVNDPPKRNIPDLKEDDTVDYPIVDAMEQEIFKTTYKNENIYNRLNRLEERVFQKTSNEDLNTRVSNLAHTMKPRQNEYTSQKNTYNSGYTEEELDEYYNQAGFDRIDPQAVPYKLIALEEDFFRKSYTHESNAARLNRLEQKIFNRTFPNETDIARLQRLTVAADAKRNSYKYENNRKMQNMATMSQLGGILLMILAIIL